MKQLEQQHSLFVNDPAPFKEVSCKWEKEKEKRCERGDSHLINRWISWRKLRWIYFALVLQVKQINDNNVFTTVQMFDSVIHIFIVMLVFNITKLLQTSSTKGELHAWNI